MVTKVRIKLKLSNKKRIIYCKK